MSRTDAIERIADELEIESTEMVEAIINRNPSLL
jgi:hypothetical protein